MFQLLFAKVIFQKCFIVYIGYRNVKHSVHQENIKLLIKNLIFLTEHKWCFSDGIYHKIVFIFIIIIFTLLF